MRIAASILFAAMTLPVQALELAPWTSTHFADDPAIGKVLAADGAETKIAAMIEAASKADVVILGESHDNPDHHRVQAAVIAEMVAAGRRPAVVFEMIPRGMQARLDAYLADGGDAAGLGAALDWKARGWPDWTIYRPIAETALKAGLPLIAGDIDKAKARAVAMEGEDVLSQAEREAFALSRTLPDESENAMLKLLSDAHCGFLPDVALSPMLTAQRARDGALADAVATAAKGNAVLITGNGHARKDWAVPAVLADTHPDLNVLVISLVEAPFDGVDTAAAPDFTIITPRANVVDHCESLAKRFGKQPKDEPDEAEAN